MSKASLRKKILEYLKAREDGKAAYAEADAALDALAAALKPGQAVELDDGRTATLVDQFAVKTVVWKPCGVRRFDLKVSEG